RAGCHLGFGSYPIMIAGGERQPESGQTSRSAATMAQRIRLPAVRGGADGAGGAPLSVHEGSAAVRAPGLAEELEPQLGAVVHRPSFERRVLRHSTCLQ